MGAIGRKLRLSARISAPRNSAAMAWRRDLQKVIG